MMRTITLTGLAAASIGLAATSAASSEPINASQLANAIQPQVEQVRWHCNTFGRCWWRPNYYGYYGYRPFFHRHFYRRWY